MVDILVYIVPIFESKNYSDCRLWTSRRTFQKGRKSLYEGWGRTRLWFCKMALQGGKNFLEFVVNADKNLEKIGVYTALGFLFARKSQRSWQLYTTLLFQERRNFRKCDYYFEEFEFIHHLVHDESYLFFQFNTRAIFHF